MTRATYTFHSTPIGTALAVLVDEVLVSLRIVPTPDDAPLDRIAEELGTAPTLVGSSPWETQLDEYFAGTRRAFDLALDWRLAHGFHREALDAIRSIPFGETASYGEIAVLAGRPGAARAVGTACARTPFALVVPVHRVVRSDGSLGEYGGHPEIKRFLLAHEGALLPAS